MKAFLGLLGLRPGLVCCVGGVVLTSRDGVVWTLGRPIAGVGAADPGTVRLKDGSLLIVGTGPPRTGTRR